MIAAFFSVLPRVIGNLAAFRFGDECHATCRWLGKLLAHVFAAKKGAWHMTMIDKFDALGRTP